MGSFSELNAQKNFFTGSWNTFSGDFHTGDNPTGRLVVNTLGEAKWVHSEGFFLSDLKKQHTGCTSSEKSLNNYSSLTLSLTIECASTDTINTFNLSGISIGNPFYIVGSNVHVKSLKNNSDVDVNCFYSANCRLNTFDSFLRRESSRVVIEEELFIGSATNQNMTIEEVRFTDETIEVLLFFDKMDSSYDGILNPPGSEKAFFIRDAQGNRYDLITQYGWRGPDKLAFGSFTIPSDTEQHILLFFEPASNPQSIRNISLLEGTCESGCWNFYDVRLKD
jgi:hypothetical protein